jgi:hypothetical protein
MLKNTIKGIVGEANTPSAYNAIFSFIALRDLDKSASAFTKCSSFLVGLPFWFITVSDGKYARFLSSLSNFIFLAVKRSTAFSLMVTLMPSNSLVPLKLSLIFSAKTDSGQIMLKKTELKMNGLERKVVTIIDRISMTKTIIPV